MVTGLRRILVTHTSHPLTSQPTNSMALPRELRLVLTTPETTLLDETVQALQLPLYDGQMGIFPGRAPLIGRLGYGELKVTAAAGVDRSYFIDGGFVQVKGPVVSILTNRAIPAGRINAHEAEERLAQARSVVPRNEAESLAREREQLRARRMLALSRKAR